MERLLENNSETEIKQLQEIASIDAFAIAGPIMDEVIYRIGLIILEKVEEHEGGKISKILSFLNSHTEFVRDELPSLVETTIEEYLNGKDKITSNPRIDTVLYETDSRLISTLEDLIKKIRNGELDIEKEANKLNTDIKWEIGKHLPLPSNLAFGLVNAILDSHV